MRSSLNKPTEEQGVAGTETARALAHFERFLAPHGLRLTAARKAIVEAVVRRAGHFEVEQLIAELKRRGIRGSRATVYRTLPLLTESGLIQEAVVLPETRSYEAAVGKQHHDHLICIACGKVIEFHLEELDALERRVAQMYGFRLEGRHHQLVGRCPDCLRFVQGS